MDDTLGFDENSKKSSSTEWQLGIQSDLSLLDRSKPELYQKNLCVIPKRKEISNRPQIPATLMETLSFYRSFTATASKVELYCMQQNNVNRFFWFYISNVLCKSLPMTYVYVFLSTYAPNHHYFLPKMIPICYGLNWTFVISAIFQLNVLTYNTSVCITYALTGLMYNIPWNRCRKENITINGFSYNCYNLSEFSKKFNDTNITFYFYHYVTSSNENFSLAQIEYLDNLDNYTIFDSKISVYIAVAIAIWILAIPLHKQLFKGYIWKVLHYMHIGLLTMFFFVFIHLVISYEHSNINIVRAPQEDHQNYLMNADFDILAESMTTPPMVHVISSRSMTEIKPHFHSAVIVLSNAIFYIFRAFTTNMMKNYCERWVNGTIIYWNYGSESGFYFWPIYFATLYFGDLFVLMFFILNAIVDYCTFIITYQCLIETIVCEWTWITSWFAATCIASVAIAEQVIAIKILNDTSFLIDSFVFWISISTLMETIIIFWIYPLGRIADDITFHYGLPPTRLRVWNFMIVPIFYSLKVYIIISSFIYSLKTMIDFQTYNGTRSSFLIISILLSSGGLYSFYYYVIKGRKKWTYLFKPVPEWGPSDSVSRQLRKQFDSRKYIGSQAPRILSRYLISKAEMKYYKLDIPYDKLSRRTTVSS